MGRKDSTPKQPKSPDDIHPPGADTPPTGAAAAGDERLADELASLQTELEEAKDHALRCRAEMENFKKRLARQNDEERRYSCAPMMQDVLPVLDNMDRAIDAAVKNENATGLLEGFSMVTQQLRDVLAKYDCREIEAMHKPFDPNHHEAVSQQIDDDFPAHTVINVIESGYQLHDRVIRPSKVVVSIKSPSDESKGSKE
ncbi:MAG: nucleotide exchange factor GrpE [Pirellulales bacterium]|nr:nucleotide exchange factor GrpE [Pirellulales bacterium]